jgi:PAS domain S-box-containing protein
MLSDYFLTEAHKFTAEHAYSYNHWLVILSYAVAVFASYTSFKILGRVIAAPNRLTRLNWLVTGSVAMGFGIWSMHFVAMLALQMGHDVRYEPVLTASSAVFAMLASGFAFNYVSRGSRQILRLVLAGTVLGAGIGTMHYTGMLAMRMHDSIRYDPILFAASIVVAVLLATLALRLMFFTTEKKIAVKQFHLLVTAAVMGLAVTLMHYTGMAATHFLNIHVDTTGLDGIDLQGSMVVEIVGGASFLILGLSWLGANIDQRMRSKDFKLRQSQHMLQAMVDTALDGILTFDMQGIVQTINPAGMKIFGYESEDVVGQHLSMLAPTFKFLSWNDNFVRRESDVNGQGLDDRSQIEGLCQDGSTIFLEISLSEMEVGGRLMFTAIMRDVTIRYQAAETLRINQAELRTSQQQLNAIMNSVADGVISMDENAIIHSFNVSAEKIFGYSTAEAMDKDIGILMPAPADSQHERYFLNFLENDVATKLGKRHEFMGRRKDGESFPLEIVVSRMELNGKPMFVGVCTDITQRKQAEEERAELERELLQAQKLESLGTLSGGIAHEINTPVQYVGDNIRFLQSAFVDLGAVMEVHRRLVSTARVGADLAGVLAQAAAVAEAADLDFLVTEIPSSLNQSIDGIGRISEIVQAIKEFSHPDAKEKTALDINRALTTTTTVSRNQWKDVAELETHFDMSLPQVQCLPGELNQVFLNMIINAAHAIEGAGRNQQGRIIISTAKQDDWVEIRIGDTGVGIPEKNLTKIFDPFFTTKEPGKGTGQGLAISHRIITKKHGGTISVESEVGKGTTFVIRLPIVSSKETEAAA